jgi:hypothetical protein
MSTPRLISASNPIHKLRELLDEQREISRQLAPFYAAADLLSPEGSEQLDLIGHLETLPAFRPLWERSMELRISIDNIMIRLAMAYERI